jgi:hypothetical protein
LKNIIAKREFRMEAKFKVPITVPWTGRILASCNNDFSSIQALPELTKSVQDKLIILKPLGNKDLFKGDNILQMEDELGYFATYLYHYKIPIEYQDVRFGTIAYSNPELLTQIKAMSPKNSIEETLKNYLLTIYTKGILCDEQGFYESSVNKLYAAMKNDIYISKQLEYVSQTTLQRFMIKIKEGEYSCEWAHFVSSYIWRFDCKRIFEMHSIAERSAMITFDPEINPTRMGQ